MRVTNEQILQSVERLGGRVDRVATRVDGLATRVDDLAEHVSSMRTELTDEVSKVSTAANDSAHELGRQMARLTTQVNALKLPWKILGSSIQLSTKNWQFVAMAATAAGGAWAYFGFPALPF